MGFRSFVNTQAFSFLKIYDRHFAYKMWANVAMVMMNPKGLALQSPSPSHKVWRRRKTTHTRVKHHDFCNCPNVLGALKERNKT